MNIINGVPGVEFLGTDDRSGRLLITDNSTSPQHIPLFYIFSSKGGEEKETMNSNLVTSYYGERTFDPKDSFTNHQTLLLESVIKHNDKVCVKRLLPSDVNIKANATIYIDILETDVPNYKRDSFGAILRNSNGEKVLDADSSIPGLKIKFIKETSNEVGFLPSIKEGTMVDGAKHSTMYPLFKFEAFHYGSEYNNIGFNISDVTINDYIRDINESSKSLSYNLSLFKRKDTSNTGVVQRTLSGSPYEVFSLKSGAINVNSNSEYDLNNVFYKPWYNETEYDKQVVFRDYSPVIVFEDNIKTVQTKLMNSEKKYISGVDKVFDDGFGDTLSWYDFTTDVEADYIKEIFMLNPFTLKSTKGVPYQSIVFSTEAPVSIPNCKEINMSLNVPIYLENGNDGTMTDAEFERLVLLDVEKYNDPNSDYMELAVNEENTFYDTGFSMTVKKKLVDFVKYRKNTVLFLSTHLNKLTSIVPLMDHSSVAMSLKANLALAPESIYFNTPVSRVSITMGTGVLDYYTKKKRISQVYELAMILSKLAGSINGKWDATHYPSSYPSNKLSYLTDLEPKNIPTVYKTSLWSSGLIWSQKYETGVYIFPGMQTVYEDDTSILNNITTQLVISSCVTLANKAWLNFTNNTDLSEAQFIDAVTEFLSKKIEAIGFHGFTVIPEVIITDADRNRGYSWKILTKIYGENMKRKMIHYSEVYRSSDLEGGVE